MGVNMIFILGSIIFVLLVISVLLAKALFARRESVRTIHAHTDSHTIIEKIKDIAKLRLFNVQKCDASRLSRL